MMENVLFIDTWSMGNVFGSVAESLKKSLADIGVAMYRVNILSEDFLAEMTKELNARSYEFALSFIGVGKGCVSGNDSLWEVAKLPLITLYGDSPAYFFDSHYDFPSWSASLYMFEEHLKLREMFAMLRGFHGVAPMLPYSKLDDAPIDWKRKESGKLIFLKNGNDPQRLFEFWRQAFNPQISAALIDLAKDLASDLDRCSHDDIVGRVQAHLHELGLRAGAERLMLIMTAQLDDYLRRVKSTMLADVLLDYSAEVHGLNWEHLRAEGRKGKLVPDADYSKSESLIRDSLAIFDMSPNTVLGIHDRVARAASHETLCVTNSGQQFAKQHSNHELFTYDFNEESLRARIEWVLGHREEALELGREFSRQFRATYTMERAYGQLKQIAACMRQNHSNEEIEGSQPFFMWPPVSYVKTSKHKPVYAEEIAHLGQRLERIEQTLQVEKAMKGEVARKKSGMLKRMLGG